MISIQFHLTRAILDILSSCRDTNHNEKQGTDNRIFKQEETFYIYIDSKRDFFLKLAFSRPV